MRETLRRDERGRKIVSDVNASQKIVPILDIQHLTSKQIHDLYFTLEHFQYTSGDIDYWQSQQLNLLIVVSSSSPVLGVYRLETYQYRPKAPRFILFFVSLVKVLDFYFLERRARRAEFLIRSTQKPLISSLKKLEVPLEGTLRNFFFIGGRQEDAILFSVLSVEYPVIRAKILALWKRRYS